MEEEVDYGLDEIHQYLLQILVYIDEFCKSHGIKYSLDGGSLLGAVRHQGYIPWDDDIDVVFTRREYEKFIAALSQEIDDQYCLVNDIWVTRITRKDNPEKNNGKKCIDFFVLDNSPDQYFIRNFKIFLLLFLQGTLKVNIKYSSYNGIEKILIFVTNMVGKLFSKRFKQKLYDKVAMWGNKKESEKLMTSYSLFRDVKNKRFDANIPKKYIDLQFENHMFMCFYDYDEYLTEMYGDYMKLPPIEQRKPTHS